MRGDGTAHLGKDLLLAGQIFWPAFLDEVHPCHGALQVMLHYQVPCQVLGIQSNSFEGWGRLLQAFLNGTFEIRSRIIYADAQATAEE